MRAHRGLAVVIAGFLLIACASQIMQRYVGKDVREIVIDYGPPANAFDMGDGRRAFQWVMRNSQTMPVVATTTGTVSAYGNMAWVNSNTTISGGQTINSQCVYTLFARWNEGANGWTVTEFRRPNLMCE
jgi:hypothetical protein